VIAFVCDIKQFSTLSASVWLFTKFNV